LAGCRACNPGTTSPGPFSERRNFSSRKMALGTRLAILNFVLLADFGARTVFSAEYSRAQFWSVVNWWYFFVISSVATHNSSEKSRDLISSKWWSSVHLRSNNGKHARICENWQLYNHETPCQTERIWILKNQQLSIYFHCCKTFMSCGQLWCTLSFISGFDFAELPLRSGHMMY